MCVTLTACLPAGPAGIDHATHLVGELRIPEPASGTCAMDYRAAISRIGLDGDLEWSTDIPWVDSSLAPVIVDGAVVQGTVRGPLAVDEADGRPLWQWDGDLDLAELDAAPPGVVTAAGGDLAALEPRSGDVTWTWSGTGDLSPAFNSFDTDPRAPRQLVAVREADTVTAVDPVSGEVQWEVDATGRGDQLLDVTADGASVVELADAAGVIARRADTGAVRWRWQSASDQLAYGSVQSSDDVVVVHLMAWSGDDGTGVPGPDANRVVALDPTDGHELWRVPFAAEGGHASLVTDQAVLLWDEGEIRALDPLTGDLLWEASRILPGANAVFLAVHEGLLVVVPLAHAGSAIALDLATGEELWRTSLEGEIFSPPAFVTGQVLVGSAMGHVDAPEDGRVQSLDLGTGDVGWTATFRDGVGRAPVPSADGVIVTSSDGVLFCD